MAVSVKTPLFCIFFLFPGESEFNQSLFRPLSVFPEKVFFLFLPGDFGFYGWIFGILPGGSEFKSELNRSLKWSWTDEGGVFQGVFPGESGFKSELNQMLI